MSRPSGGIRTRPLGSASEGDWAHKIQQGKNNAGEFNFLHPDLFKEEK